MTYQKKPQKIFGDQHLIKEIKRDIFAQIPSFRIPPVTPNLSEKQKKERREKIEKIFNELKKQKKEREIQQAEIFKQYLKKIKEIPLLDPNEEKKLKEEMWTTGNIDIKKIEKIGRPNLKIIVPTIYSITRKKDNPLFTPLELILFGERVLNEIVIGWINAQRKKCRFSTYLKIFIKENFKYIEGYTNLLSSYNMPIELWVRIKNIEEYKG